jgi:hypothetical protein
MLVQEMGKGDEMGRELIYKDDAIKTIDDLPNAYNGWSDAYDKALIIETLEEVPAVEPKRGEWEHLWDAPDGTYKGRCTRCGLVHYFIESHDSQYNFCPSCGARMNDERE